MGTLEVTDQETPGGRIQQNESRKGERKKKRRQGTASTQKDQKKGNTANQQLNVGAGKSAGGAAQSLNIKK